MKLIEIMIYISGHIFTCIWKTKSLDMAPTASTVTWHHPQPHYTAVHMES